MSGPKSHALTNLERQLQEKYHLRDTVVDFGGRLLSVLSVESIDDLLDQVVDEDDIPFWAEIWPASLGVLQFLVENPDFVLERTVLELGCGVGAVGLGVQICGGVLTQTDFITEALQFAAVNAARNMFSPVPTLLADWRAFPREKQYDRIIGSDILYEKKLHPYLYSIFKHVLTEKGQILLADPGRGYAKVFMDELPKELWRWSQVQQIVYLDGQKQIIDLYLLEKCG